MRNPKIRYHLSPPPSCMNPSLPLMPQLAGSSPTAPVRVFRATPQLITPLIIPWGGRTHQGAWAGVYILRSAGEIKSNYQDSRPPPPLPPPPLPCNPYDVTHAGSHYHTPPTPPAAPDASRLPFCCSIQPCFPAAQPSSSPPSSAPSTFPSRNSTASCVP